MVGLGEEVQCWSIILLDGSLDGEDRQPHGKWRITIIERLLYDFNWLSSCVEE